MDTPRILLSGWYGADNAGDEAILQQFIHELVDQKETSRLTVLSEWPDRVETCYRDYGVRAIYHCCLDRDLIGNLRNGAFGRLMQAVLDADMFVLGGGGILRDNTSWRNVLRLLDEIWLAKLVGTPVVLYAIGAGPFVTRSRSWLIRQSLRLCDLVTVRDESSRTQLEGIGVPPERIVVVADPGLLLDPERPKNSDTIALIDSFALRDRTIGLFPTREHLPVPSLARALDRLHQDCGFYFVSIPMRCYVGPDDRHVSREVRAAMKHPEALLIIEEPLKASEIKWLCGRFHINLTVRLHASIFSLAMKTPAVAINYAPKVAGFMSTFGVEDFCVDTTHNFEEEVVQKVLVCHTTHGKYVEHLKARVPDQLKAAAHAFALIRQRIVRADHGPDVKMNLRKLAKDSSFYLAGSLATRAAGILMTPIYARFLSPAEYGSVELLELCTQIVVITLGIQALGGSLTRVYYDTKDAASQATVASTALINTAALGTLITILAWAAAPGITRWLFHSDAHTVWIRLAFVAMFSSSLAEVSLIYQRLRDRVPFVVKYSLVQLAVTIALNVYFIIFAKYGVLGFVLSKLIVSSVGAAVLLTVQISQTGIHWGRKASASLNSFGLPLILSGIAMFIIHFSDRFFIDQYRTLGDVGAYSLAYKFAFLVSYLVGEPFGRVFNISAYASAGEPGWSWQVGRATVYLTFCLFALGLGLSIFAPQLIQVVAGSAYARAAMLIPVLVFGYVLREIGDVFRTLLYAKKRPYSVSAISVGCAALNIALNFLLIPKYGTTGAAWATLVTWIAYLGSCWLVANRELRIHFGVTSFARICTVALCCFWFTRSGFMQNGNTPLAWAQNSLIMLVFCVLLLLTGYWPGEERRTLADLLTRQFAKST